MQILLEIGKINKNILKVGVLGNAMCIASGQGQQREQPWAAAPLGAELGAIDNSPARGSCLMQGAMWCEAATSHCWAWLGAVIAATKQLASSGSVPMPTAAS
jgi:hypothetical protein